MGLDDRESLAVLASVLTDRVRREDLTRDFYASWFAADPGVRDLFPPDLAGQRMAVGQAVGWVVEQLAARRAETLVAFLAQLGRDHRKHGATREHYSAANRAMHRALRENLAGRWTPRVDDTATAVLSLITGVMAGAAETDEGPSAWSGTVLQHNRVSRDIAVVRLMLDQPLPYHAGQYVSVEVPQCPRRWRYLSPAIPSDPGGFIEFHIRSVPGGLVSPAVVAETRPGDCWQLSAPHGGLHVDRGGGDVLMVAGSTGLAPLRALILDLARSTDPPRVHLFFGARYPCELYDLKALWELAGRSPWLSVSPVSEFRADPPWAADYPDVQPPRGLHVRQTGRLPLVVGSYGGWSDRQILICGRPEMVRATRTALLTNGTPAERIQHDPLGS